MAQFARLPPTSGKKLVTKAAGKSVTRPIEANT
jgi:hypothetical protein